MRIRIFIAFPPKPIVSEGILLVHRCVTKLASKSNVGALSHSFHGSGVQAQVSRVLCSGAHQAEIKVMSGSAVLSETWGPLQARVAYGGWQSSFPCELNLGMQ